MRRFVRAEAVFVVVLLAFGARAVGCKKKQAVPMPRRPTPKIFSDFTPPPPHPTLTMPPGITRVPTLPE